MASQDFPRIDPAMAQAVGRLVHGATFDDFLLTPQRSILARRDPTVIDLSCRVSQHLTLKRPIVSANMDTVTRAPMAIVQAEEGGIGMIDRGFRSGDIQPQVREVEIVKRTQHGVISDPYSVAPAATLEQAAALMARSRVGTLVVLDADRRLKGLLTEAHYADHGPFYGVRFNNLPGDDFQDLYPLLVWSVLRKYLHDNQMGIIFDLNPGVEVDSHPAYRYRLTTQSMGGDVYQGQLSLWVADLVPPDFVGTATERKDYTFTFKAHDGQIAAGSDHWTGDSLNDHPDFAWYPAERGQANPELDYTLVSQIAAQAR